MLIPAEAYNEKRPKANAPNFQIMFLAPFCLTRAFGFIAVCQAKRTPAFVRSNYPCVVMHIQFSWASTRTRVCES
ncbi:hypothetical protein BDU57DRAFT_271143 [Ampelomyces quisqualis]|uniref:Uncharacterized protein n=1 Tax=Ampelomyces quisqualis TaxID=50730 RepID=A0A6A5QMT9_AMPQU|nr:hypothetical protein BDU57DRAFT_271143 [Ampelomyces quisqualis]